jgi:hypothetical protein
MTPAPTGIETITRNEFESGPQMRSVASVLIDSGRSAPIMVYANQSGTRFYVDTPGLPVIRVEKTIRKALKLALHNGGWG